LDVIKKKWGRGVNCEEEMREKNEMGEGDVCVWWGRRKKKGRGYMSGGGKKKRKKKWGLGSGVYMYGAKKGGVEKKEEEKN
jgi:hypothetical protein